MSSRSQGGSERGSSFTYKLDPRKASTSVLDQPPPLSSTSQGQGLGQGLGQGSNHRGVVAMMGGNNSNGGNMEGIAAWGKRVRDKPGSSKVTTFQVDFPGLSRNQVITSRVCLLSNSFPLQPSPLSFSPPMTHLLIPSHNPLLYSHPHDLTCQPSLIT